MYLSIAISFNTQNDNYVNDVFRLWGRQSNCSAEFFLFISFIIIMMMMIIISVIFLRFLIVSFCPSFSFPQALPYFSFCFFQIHALFSWIASIYN